MNNVSTSSLPALIASGSYRASYPAAQIEWKLKNTPNGPAFSASGTIEGSGGQCLEAIAAAHPEDATIQDIVAVWRDYHLNDMKAGTVHQKGWGDKRITLTRYAAPILTNATIYPSVSELERELKGWVYSSYMLGNQEPGEIVFGNKVKINASGMRWDEFARVVRAVYETHVAKPTNPLDARVTYFAARFGCVKSEETKFAGHVYPTEHPEGVLGKPCPVTGKGYGTEWFYHPIPADVLGRIMSWAAQDNTDGVSAYDRQAEAFLRGAGVACRITLSDTKAASWENAGHHYRVTLSKDKASADEKNGPRQSARLVFDFWNSSKAAEDLAKAQADLKAINYGMGLATERALLRDKAEAAIAAAHPSAYSVLSAIASDSSCPETFKDFCSEYGYEADSIKTLQTFRRCSAFGKRLRAFFTADELAALAEIQ